MSEYYSFYLSFLHCFEDQRLFHTFTQELSELGIPYEVRHQEQLKLNSISWE